MKWFVFLTVLPLVMLLMPAESARAQASARVAATGPPGAAIYLQHIGESDKPINPMVFASTRPATDELKRVLGEREARFANVILLSPADLGRAAQEVGRQLALKETPPARRVYGTFRVTLIRDGGEIVREVNRPRTLAIVAAIEQSLQKHDEVVSARAAQLRARLKGGEGR